MNVSMMQPPFLPWQGYFELIDKSDIFIFLDTFQFSKQGWDQRNRMFIDKNRIGWYILPVLKKFKSLSNETTIFNGIPWRKKMWARIKTNYGRCEYFTCIEKDLQDWLLKSTATTLASFNIEFTKLICNKLGIKTEFRKSSEFPLVHKRSQGVLDLLRAVGSTRYYSANSSFSYMVDECIFPVSDIEIFFQNFQCRPYYQVGSPHQFIPYLSVIDAIMNSGYEKTYDLIHNGTPNWLTWNDMIRESGHG